LFFGFHNTEPFIYLKSSYFSAPFIEDTGCCSGPQYVCRYFHWVQRWQQCKFRL